MELVENDSMNIRDVTDIGGLLRYFRDHLNWNLGVDDFSDIEDFMYGFDANDLGLKDDEFAKVKLLYQLPPLEEDQQWGIFCVEFNPPRSHAPQRHDAFGLGREGPALPLLLGHGWQPHDLRCALRAAV